MMFFMFIDFLGLSGVVLTLYDWFFLYWYVSYTIFMYFFINSFCFAIAEKKTCLPPKNRDLP